VSVILLVAVQTLVSTTVATVTLSAIGYARFRRQRRGH